MTEEDKSQGESELHLTCPSCHSMINFMRMASKETLQYCPCCGFPLYDAHKSSSLESGNSLGEISLIQEHLPLQEQIQFTIGPYQILSNIGKGGMGEVFLAYDTTCGRRIALKRIRTDLSNHRQLYNRFIKEARITSQLTHPSIIPIYAIHVEDHLIYYTMPFVEGETLKQILRKTRRQEKQGEKLDHLGGSIPALIRIFINICQAVAYAHSKNVLHRDLKPENIIIGKYGEVLILDWGLAKLIKTDESNDEKGEITRDSSEESNVPHQMTRSGKVVGTISYMAPERALGQPATIQTDIYSLGVILYQILTLHLPFSRGTLKEFQHSIGQEKFLDPSVVAPYRDVPSILSQIARKCLSPNLSQRYSTVQYLTQELENYIEGRSEWFLIAELDIHNKADWEFQENVLIAEHIAITRHTEVSDWVNLMVSKLSITENTKVDVLIRLGERCHGIGFLLSIPEAEEREHLNDGYCLWLGSEKLKATKLLRSTVEVMNAPDIYLKRYEWYTVCLEKIEHNIHFYLNGIFQFSYISHSPLIGTHIGLLARDADFEIAHFHVYSGSQNITVKCLAVPDAFFAHKDFSKALSEYRRIGYSFSGRAEGREAMFRAGITLMEQAKDEKDPIRLNHLYDLALQEFEKLHSTPGAPLEYLGKALVYEALHDYEEEIKCFELACRRYAKHPLLPVLQEQILFRMHETSHHHRLATYHFILLVVRHLPKIAQGNHVRKLFGNLQKHWEHLNFFEDEPACDFFEQLRSLQFGITLSFWLAKPYVILEIIEDLIKLDNISVICIGNALFGLIEIGSKNLASKAIEKITSSLSLEKHRDLQKTLKFIEIALKCTSESLSAAFERFFSQASEVLTFEEQRILIYLIEFGIDEQQTSITIHYEEQIKSYSVDKSGSIYLESAMIWTYLIEKQWEKAENMLHKYPLEDLSKDSTLLHFLTGCWLYISEGKDIAYAHFSGIMEVSYPRTWTLFTHFLLEKITHEQRWHQKAFLWEKRQLYRQAVLFYHCSGNNEQKIHYQKLMRQEYIDIEEH